MIDNEVFCERHKEEIIKRSDVARFNIRRLTENEQVFRDRQTGCVLMHLKRHGNYPAGVFGRTIFSRTGDGRGVLVVECER